MTLVDVTNAEIQDIAQAILDKIQKGNAAILRLNEEEKQAYIVEINRLKAELSISRAETLQAEAMARNAEGKMRRMKAEQEMQAEKAK